MNVNTRTERNENLWRECIERGRQDRDVAQEFGISRSRVRDIVVREANRRRYRVRIDGHSHPVRAIHEVRAVWLSLQPKEARDD